MGRGLGLDAAMLCSALAVLAEGHWRVETSLEEENAKRIALGSHLVLIRRLVDNPLHVLVVGPQIQPSTSPTICEFCDLSKDTPRHGP